MKVSGVIPDHDRAPVLALHGATRDAVNFALAEVVRCAERAGQGGDTDTTRQALLAVRSAAIRAYETITDAERKTRAEALARVRTFA